jgi:hypothetical protein
MRFGGAPYPRRVLLAGALSLLAGNASGADAARGELDVVLHGSGGTEVVGKLRIGPSFILTLVSAVPAREAWVQSLIKRMNGETTLQLDAPPPPGAPRFALASQPIGRGDPRFGEAMRQELRKYYDVELR